MGRLTAKLVDRSTAKLVNRLTAKLMNRLTAKLVGRLTTKLVVVNLVKLHLTKFNQICIFLVTVNLRVSLIIMICAVD